MALLRERIHRSGTDVNRTVCGTPKADGRERLPEFEQAEPDGASRTRTGDLLGAIQALSQLSYSPERTEV